MADLDYTHASQAVTLVDETSGYSAAVDSAGYVASGIRQNVIASTLNSTAATPVSPTGTAQNQNLASEATWTGTSESTLGCAYIQYMFKSDSTCTVSLEQSIDGTNWDTTHADTFPANDSQAHSHAATGAYFRIRVTNIGGATTTYIRLGAYLCPIANECPQTNGVAGAVESDHFPNPASRPTGEYASLRVDPDGRLAIRAAIGTDEGSFNERFPGASLKTTLVDAVAFKNGLSIVTAGSTNFNSLQYGQYIRASADADTNMAQIKSVDGTSSMTLMSGYPGSTVSGNAVYSNWYQAIGSGGAITVAAGNCTLGTGTTNAADTYLFRLIDTPNLQLIGRFSLSQRIANQTFVFGFRTAISAPSLLTQFQFTGTSNTSVDCISTTSSGDTTTTTVTLPGGVTTATLQSYEIRATQDKIVFFVNRVQMSVHTATSPNSHTALGVFIEALNGTSAASNTNLVVDSVSVLNQNIVDMVAHQGDASKLQVTANAIYAANPPILVTGQSASLMLTQDGSLRVSQGGGAGPTTPGAGESYAKRAYNTTVGVTLTSLNNEQNMLLFRNPVLSARTVYVRNISFTSLTSGKECIVTVYSNPTISATANAATSCTFQDAGDTVTLNSHGRINGDIVVFATIVTTTGISTNTEYYVVGAALNTFQVAATLNGSALPLTTNGTGTIRNTGPSTLPASMYIGGGATAALSKTTSGPWNGALTTPSSGHPITAPDATRGLRISISGDTNEQAIIDYDWGLLIASGSSLLVTGTPSANNVEFVANIIWTEVS